MMPIKVGDVIEFAPLLPLHSTDDGSDPTQLPPPRPLATGKVVDVDALECVVQVSPFEPLQRVKLRDAYYKVVYEAGEMPRLTPAMTGWEIEIISAETQQPEPAIIKRVDTEMNCVLVVFASGKKEWMDLSMTKFKVIGRPSFEPSSTSPSRRSASINSTATNQTVVESDASVYGGSGRTMQEGIPADSELIPPIKMLIPRLSVPLRAPSAGEQVSGRRMSTAFVSMNTPSVDTEEFDWYTEGGHVELCDSEGAFHEGAILCSRTQTHVQLFNEHRQFFEVSIAVQTFKVVIHGLLSLKTIPMGQSIDVYSPMTGGFRNGTVLKTAELGRLTPVSFPPGKAVEWLDLSTQTFKLMFAPPASQAPERPASVKKAATHLGLERQTFQTSNSGVSSPSHRSPSRPHFRRSVQCPHLQLGQRVELFDEDSKQYLKYKVTKVLDVGAHEYIFEPHAQSSSDSSPAKSPQIGSQRPVVGALPQLRCRLPLQASQWQEYRELLVGQRVDVYDKIGKSVAAGRVMGVAAADAEPSLLVRYKDGRKEWVFLRSSKVKLRLHGHGGGVTESSGAPSPLGNRAADASDSTHASDVTVEERVRSLFTPGSRDQDAEKDSFDAVGTVGGAPQRPSARCRPKLNHRLSDCPSTDFPAHQQVGFTNSLRRVEVECGEGGEVPNDKAVVKHEAPAELAPTPARRPKPNRHLSDYPSSDLAPHRQQQFAPSGENGVSSEIIAQPDSEESSGSNVRQAVKPIDLGQLVRFAQSDTDDGTESSDAVHSSRGQAPAPASSAKNNRIQAPSDLDLWTEEVDPVQGIIQYVHVLTGVKQQPRPTWLRRIDPASGKCFAVHTPTDTVVELSTGPSKASGRLSARGSSSSGKVTLPVGPIEAVRAQGVLDQLPTSEFT